MNSTDGESPVKGKDALAMGFIFIALGVWGVVLVLWRAAYSSQPGWYFYPPLQDWQVWLVAIPLLLLGAWMLAIARRLRRRERETGRVDCAGGAGVSQTAVDEKTTVRVQLETDSQQATEATLPDVEAAIRALDGATRTLVVVLLDDGQRLTVAGGPARCVVEIDVDGQHRHAVVEPCVDDEPVQLCAGGQTADFPAKLCVPRNSAIEAARAFVLEAGARSEFLTWSVES